MTKAQYIKAQCAKNRISKKLFLEMLKRNREKIVMCKCGYACCSGFIIQPINY